MNDQFAKARPGRVASDCPRFPCTSEVHDESHPDPEPPHPRLAESPQLLSYVQWRPQDITFPPTGPIPQRLSVIPRRQRDLHQHDAV